MFGWNNSLLYCIQNCIVLYSMFLSLLPGCPAEGLVMVPYNSTRHLYNSQTEEQNNRIVIATM